MLEDPYERRDLMTDALEREWGAAPSIWVRAPGRVDLMGSHTDYNLGYVVTMPISRDTWIAAAPRNDSRVRLYSLNLEARASFSVEDGERDREQPWTNYVRGVACGFRAEGLPVRGFDGVIHSTVPVGGGLSSSAALECATATLFQHLGQCRLPPRQTALLCQKAENDFAGVQCGVLDQFTSCLGEEGCALLLDCRDLTTRRVPIAKGIGVVICDTRAPRELALSAYGSRRAECQEAARQLEVAALRDATPATVRSSLDQLGLAGRRALFIVEENERGPKLAAALGDGDRHAIRSLCLASFEGARDLYEICSGPMNAMMDAMLSAPGVIGARQAGAGFGGCMVAFVDQASTREFAASVSASYQAATGMAPEIYPVEAAAGAGLVGAACHAEVTWAQ